MIFYSSAIKRRSPTHQLGTMILKGTIGNWKWKVIARYKDKDYRFPAFSCSTQNTRSYDSSLSTLVTQPLKRCEKCAKFAYETSSPTRIVQKSLHSIQSPVSESLRKYLGSSNDECNSLSSCNLVNCESEIV